MGRRSLLIGVVLALAAAAPAAAAPRVLWPGVTYDQQVQTTSRGPVIVHVLTGPRPGGSTTLEPLLSNESLLGRETVTSMQKRTETVATTAGISGDFSNFETGLPSGVVIRETQLLFPPYGDRSSAGILADGTLDVRRISFFATWQGTALKHTLNDLNRPVRANGAGLFTSAYAASTPSYADGVAVVLFPLPTAVPGVDLPAPVVEARGAGAVPIPPGGAVLVARGTAAAALTAEAPVGSTAILNFALRPDWPGVVSAIGGGPQIVRDGKPVFQANEAFLASQLQPQTARAAVGQLADGRIVLVAVDGRQPGYSIGLTTFQLAQALVRLGAVTAMALDGGGSVTMAAAGELLNRPSDGQERPVANALVFAYSGVFVQPPLPVVSPNADGVDDEQTLRYKLVRPSNVTVTLTAPNRAVAYTETVDRPPGIVDVPFPIVSTQAAKAPTTLNGKWTLTVRALDDLGRETSMSQSFKVNTTLGALRVAKRLFLPPGGRNHPIVWRQGRKARVTVTIEDKDGQVVRTLALRRYQSGPRQVIWNGLDRARKRVKGGVYTARVMARNTLGTTELTAPIRVRQIVGPKKPRQ
jgi:hypothetical protein